MAAAVLSGNRNFEGRINPHVKANYLASRRWWWPMRIAGTIDIDLTTEPTWHKTVTAKKVYLKDIWPTQKEIAETMARCVRPEMFTQQYSNVYTPRVAEIPGAVGESISGTSRAPMCRSRRSSSTCLSMPGRFTSIAAPVCLVSVGDSTTTDHIQSGWLDQEGLPAGSYLQEQRRRADDFNSYGPRGNDRVMTRGTFANIRLKNLLAPGTEGGVTTYLPDRRADVDL